MDKDNDKAKEKEEGKDVIEISPSNNNQNANMTTPLGHGAQEESEANRAIMKNNPKTQKVMPGPEVAETSSSSEGEDMALLEEVTRIKARLEAKLRAKQLRKLAKGQVMDSVQGQDAEPVDLQETLDNGSESERNLTLTPKRATRHSQMTSTPKQDSPIITDENEGSRSDMTTPTKRPSPLVSPGFRTPSPPERTRFLMSPPSGASSRKRQHSPSPLPRQSSLSLSQQRARSTPTSGRVRVMGGPTSTPTKRLLAYRTGNLEKPPSVKGSVDLFQDLFDDDLDGDLLDALLDDEEDQGQPALDGMGTKTVDVWPIASSGKEEHNVDETSLGIPKATTDDKNARPTLTEVVEAQKQKREAEQDRQQCPKMTFLNMTSYEPLSTEEVAKLGHTPDFDPTTGLNIKDRVIPFTDMARMTRGLRVIQIKDSDRIRENSAQRHAGGVLRSSAPTTGLTGSLRSAGDKKASLDLEPENWVVAGVVGAKSKQRMTAKKVKYCHFQLGDLQSSLINVFMFRDVMTRHYDKIRVGDVVAILNPKVLHQAERSGTLGVELDHPDCLLVLGTSADYGLCEAVKLNEEKCGRLLNKRGSAYCNYHIMMATNKRRNQRGSLIAGTSSIYDLDKPPLQTNSAALPRKIGGPKQSSLSSEKLRMMARESRETTYIFDDNGVGTSSLTDQKSSRKDQQQPDDSLSTFLMNQNNPGGQYLRQAKTSKDVAWAKDVTSPKMIRRMGYNPVSGQFVPGSPKRMNDDLAARERSIRMLAERVKSPPAPMRPLTDLLPQDRKRTIDVKGTTRPIARPRSSKMTAITNGGGGKEVQGDVFFGSQSEGVAASNTAPKKWVDLDDDNSSDGSDAEGLLSLSEQRAKNLLESRNSQGHKQVVSSSINLKPKPKPKPNSTAQLDVLTTTKRKISLPSSGEPLISRTFATSQISKVSSLDPRVDPIDSSGANTQLHAPPASSIPPSDSQVIKKQRFIDFSDSE
ncbi:hypothetical protein BGZ46_009132 [Entomortierella lignicola]|nr:hypothetical protein BGZ46_009132 [Entomortierella lignicola]